MQYESKNVYSITIGNSPNSPATLVSDALNANALDTSIRGIRIVHEDGITNETQVVSITGYEGETASLMVYDPDAESLASDALYDTQELPMQSQRLSRLSYDEDDGTLSLYDSSDNELADSCTLPTAATLKLSRIALEMSNLAKIALNPMIITK